MFPATRVASSTPLPCPAPSPLLVSPQLFYVLLAALLMHFEDRIGRARARPSRAGGRRPSEVLCAACAAHITHNSACTTAGSTVLRAPLQAIIDTFGIKFDENENDAEWFTYAHRRAENTARRIALCCLPAHPDGAHTYTRCTLRRGPKVERPSAQVFLAPGMHPPCARCSALVAVLILTPIAFALIGAVVETIEPIYTDYEAVKRADPGFHPGCCEWYCLGVLTKLPGGAANARDLMSRTVGLREALDEALEELQAECVSASANLEFERLASATLHLGHLLFACNGRKRLAPLPLGAMMGPYGMFCFQLCVFLREFGSSEAHEKLVLAPTVLEHAVDAMEALVLEHLEQEEARA